MGFRKIRGLQWVRPAARPGFARGRARGVKRQGVLYERKLAAELGSAWNHGQWFEFEDAHGPGFCQVDFLRKLSDAVVVLEAKLTWLPEAHQQIGELYKPIVEACWGMPVVGVVVAKLLPSGCQAAIAHTLPSAIEAAQAVPRVVLHWSGKASLYPDPCLAAARRLPLSSGSSNHTVQ